MKVFIYIQLVIFAGALTGLAYDALIPCMLLIVIGMLLAAVCVEEGDKEGKRMAEEIFKCFKS